MRHRERWLVLRSDSAFESGRARERRVHACAVDRRASQRGCYAALSGPELPAERGRIDVEGPYSGRAISSFE